MNSAFRCWFSRDLRKVSPKPCLQKILSILRNIVINVDILSDLIFEPQLTDGQYAEFWIIQLKNTNRYVKLVGGSKLREFCDILHRIAEKTMENCEYTIVGQSRRAGNDCEEAKFNSAENFAKAMSRMAALLKVYFTIPKIDFSVLYTSQPWHRFFMTHNDDLRNISCWTISKFIRKLWTLCMETLFSFTPAERRWENTLSLKSLSVNLKIFSFTATRRASHISAESHLSSLFACEAVEVGHGYSNLVQYTAKQSSSTRVIVDGLICRFFSSRDQPRLSLFHSRSFSPRSDKRFRATSV